MRETEVQIGNPAYAQRWCSDERATQDLRHDFQFTSKDGLRIAYGRWQCIGRALRFADSLGLRSFISTVFGKWKSEEVSVGAGAAVTLGDDN